MAKKKRQNKQTRRAPRKGRTELAELQEAACLPPAPATPPMPEIDPSAEGAMILEESSVAVATEPSSSASPLSMPSSTADPAVPKRDERDPHSGEDGSEPIAPEELELLTFNLGREEYAVDIMLIQEITKVTDVTHIPRIPSYIKGIITLRGNVIPVFDMHARLGLAPFVKGPKSRFIICAAESGTVAMMVDYVNDVVRLMKQDLEAPPAGVAAIDAGFIKNIAKQKDRLLILLDIDKTLQIDR